MTRVHQCYEKTCGIIADNDCKNKRVVDSERNETKTLRAIIRDWNRCFDMFVEASLLIFAVFPAAPSVCLAI